MPSEPHPGTPVRSPEDFEHLGKAFEGLAASLHAGLAVERPDLDAACRVAHDLWPVRSGAPDPYARDFEAARQVCRANAGLAAAGDAKALAAVERACRQMGAALRRKAHHLAQPPPPWESAPTCRARIHDLDRKYRPYVHVASR